MLVHGGQNIIGQIVDGLVLDIVFNLQEAGGPIVAGVDSRIPYVLGILDLRRASIQVSRGIQVEV